MSRVMRRRLVTLHDQRCACTIAEVGSGAGLLLDLVGVTLHVCARRTRRRTHGGSPGKRFGGLRFARSKRSIRRCVDHGVRCQPLLLERGGHPVGGDIGHRNRVGHGGQLRRLHRARRLEISGIGDDHHGRGGNHTNAPSPHCGVGDQSFDRVGQRHRRQLGEEIDDVGDGRGRFRPDGVSDRHGPRRTVWRLRDGLAQLHANMGP